MAGKYHTFPIGIAVYSPLHSSCALGRWLETGSCAKDIGRGLNAPLFIFVIDPPVHVLPFQYLH